jgi:hypothetical protein
MTDIDMANEIRAAVSKLNDLLRRSADENGLEVKIDQLDVYEFGGPRFLQFSPAIAKRIA